MEWSLNVVRQKKGRMTKVQMLVGFILTLVIFSYSCRNSNQESGQKFYYYPKRNVYLNVNQNSFLYSVDGGKGWISFENDPVDGTKYLGDSVILFSETSDIHNENAAHRKLYGGKLFNFTIGDTFAVTSPEVAERKVLQKTQGSIAKAKNVDKPKKGIGGFFKKIFGKKDKK